MQISKSIVGTSKQIDRIREWLPNTNAKEFEPKGFVRGRDQQPQHRAGQLGKLLETAGENHTGGCHCLSLELKQT